MSSSQLEKELNKSRFDKIAGIDEAGRGPLAGPVVVVCASLNGQLNGLTDSKELSPSERASLEDQILDNCEYSIFQASSGEIDQKGINQVELSLMEQAEGYDLYVVDGKMFKPQLDGARLSVNKADYLVSHVSAASILAKEYRDRIMIECHEDYPEYNFRSNKGYGSKEHREAIEKYGPCEIHRTSFL